MSGYWVGYAITLITLIRYLRRRTPDAPHAVIAGAAVIALLWVPILGAMAVWFAVQHRTAIAVQARRLGARWSAFRSNRATAIYGQEG